MPVNEIEISSRDGEQLAVWRDPDLSQRLAADDLLAALEAQTDAAQAVIDAWEQGDLATAVNGLTTPSRPRAPPSSRLRARPRAVRHELRPFAVGFSPLRR
jgi:hypothetical protein